MSKIVGSFFSRHKYDGHGYRGGMKKKKNQDEKPGSARIKLNDVALA